MSLFFFFCFFKSFFCVCVFLFVAASTGGECFRIERLDV